MWYIKWYTLYQMYNCVQIEIKIKKIKNWIFKHFLTIVSYIILTVSHKLIKLGFEIEVILNLAFQIYVYNKLIYHWNLKNYKKYRVN